MFCKLIYEVYTRVLSQFRFLKVFDNHCDLQLPVCIDPALRNLKNFPSLGSSFPDHVQNNQVLRRFHLGLMFCVLSLLQSSVLSTQDHFLGLKLRIQSLQMELRFRCLSLPHLCFEKSLGHQTILL